MGRLPSGRFRRAPRDKLSFSYGPRGNAFGDAISAGQYADILATKSAKYFPHTAMEFDRLRRLRLCPIILGKSVRLSESSYGITSADRSGHPLVIFGPR